MREFQAKHKYKKILYSKTMVIVIAFLILFFARATWGVYQKQQESLGNAKRAITELQKLEDRQKLLTSELTRLSTDQGVEEEIRAKYGVSKPGEEMVIIVDPQATATINVLPKENWWNKFKQLFK